ncbi:MAG: hypothetical protein KDK90_21490 [Leptospiraceae bacterium]|nr:hypothetical protein [Leptospiraceae bacterium]
MKKFYKYLTALLFVFSSIIACKSDNNKNEENQRNLLLLYLVDQSSGNCMYVNKSTDTTSGKTLPVYTATGYIVQKGGCNWETLGDSYYTNSSDALTKIQSKYDEYITILSKYSDCSILKSAIETEKNNITTDVIEKDVNSLGCTTSYSTQKVKYCLSNSDIDFNRNYYRYIPVSSVTSEMATNITYYKADLKSKTSTNGFTDLQIDSMEVYGSGELATYSSNEYYLAKQVATYVLTDTANSTSHESCRSQLYKAYPDVKKLIASTNGVDTSFYNISQSYVTSNVTRVLYLTPQCKYGSGFSESATSNKSTIGTTEYSTYGTCSTKTEY